MSPIWRPRSRDGSTIEGADDGWRRGKKTSLRKPNEDKADRTAVHGLIVIAVPVSPPALDTSEPPEWSRPVTTELFEDDDGMRRAVLVRRRRPKELPELPLGSAGQ